MTEIVAAHLERVARETAEKWLGPEPYVPAMASGASWVSIPFEATFTIKPHTQLVGELTALVAAALAACAREAARPFKEALMINPFSDGQDGDLCLWCRTSYPRGLTTFEEHFLPEHHLSTCELMLVLEKWVALERAVGEKGRA